MTTRDVTRTVESKSLPLRRPAKRPAATPKREKLTRSSYHGATSEGEFMTTRGMGERRLPPPPLHVPRSPLPAPRSQAIRPRTGAMASRAERPARVFPLLRAQGRACREPKSRGRRAMRARRDQGPAITIGTARGISPRVHALRPAPCALAVPPRRRGSSAPTANLTALDLGPRPARGRPYRRNAPAWPLSYNEPFWLRYTSNRRTKWTQPL